MRIHLVNMGLNPILACGKYEYAEDTQHRHHVSQDQER